MTKKTLLLFFLFICSIGFSQSIKTIIDSTQIKIGSQFHLILKANVTLKDLVVFPEQSYIGSLEVLESFPIDTIKKSNQFELIKKYGLTQFDSGTYKIPSIPVKINNKDFFSDSATILVNNIKVDTIIQPMYDIKSVIAVKKPNSNWWIYILFILFIIGTGFLSYFLIRKIQKNKPVYNSIYISPFQKAISGYESLDKKQFSSPLNTKEYYSELTSICRIYIEETLTIPALESTSNELVTSINEEIKNRNLNIEKFAINQFHNVLKNADLVKFAKSEPDQNTIEQDKTNSKDFLIYLNKNIPKSEEEIQRQFQADVNRKSVEKERKKTTIISIGIALFFLVLMLLIFSLTIGYEYIKENYIGYTSKELLETEWVTSEYGDPAIKIETPKVLNRITDGKIPNNLPEYVKSTSKFSYGSVLDNFSITVLTTSLKDSLQINKDEIIENDIRILEQFGARNIITKVGEYNPSEKLTGKKAFGSFTIKDTFKNENVKLAYEIVVFTQPNAIQEFILIYKEGDKNAFKMMERVRNSIELKENTLQWKK